MPYVCQCLLFFFSCPKGYSLYFSASCLIALASRTKVGVTVFVDCLLGPFSKQCLFFFLLSLSPPFPPPSLLALPHTVAAVCSSLFQILSYFSALFSTVLEYEASREPRGLYTCYALGQLSQLVCLLMSILSDFLHLTEMMGMRKSDSSYNVGLLLWKAG